MANIGHRSTQRVMEILELIAFSGVEDGFSLTQVATVLKCPKSSISPILHTLAAGGYLSYDQAQMKYTIGRRLFEVGNTYLNNDDFYVQTLAIMRKVVDLCSESCHLAELRDDNVLYLLKWILQNPYACFRHPVNGCQPILLHWGRRYFQRVHTSSWRAAFQMGYRKLLRIPLLPWMNSTNNFSQFAKLVLHMKRRRILSLYNVLRFR